MPSSSQFLSECNSRCGVLVAFVQDVPVEVVLLAAGQVTHLGYMIVNYHLTLRSAIVRVITNQ